MGRSPESSVGGCSLGGPVTGAADATPERILLRLGERLELLRDLVLGQAVALEEDGQLQLAGGNQRGAAVAAELPGAARRAPEAGEDGLRLLPAVGAQVPGFVV